VRVVILSARLDCVFMPKEEEACYIVYIGRIWKSIFLKSSYNATLFYIVPIFVTLHSILYARVCVHTLWMCCMVRCAFIVEVLVWKLHSAPALWNVSVCDFHLCNFWCFFVQYNCVSACTWSGFAVELVKMRFRTYYDCCVWCCFYCKLSFLDCSTVCDMVYNYVSMHCVAAITIVYEMYIVVCTL